MQDRPTLNKNLDSKTFRDFYYLKEELVEFCRANGLPTSGGKLAITERISYFLDSGEILYPESDKRTALKDSTLLAKHRMISSSPIYLDTRIEDNFVCSEKHRAFFKEHIGKSFSFNVPFQTWLKTHAGKNYEEAIEAYYHIIEEKKINKTKIDKQFEYNTYIRDFFAANKGKSLEDAIACWTYKKQLKGHNRYEDNDLLAIKNNDSV